VIAGAHRREFYGGSADFVEISRSAAAAVDKPRANSTLVEGMRLSEFELDVMAHFWSDGQLSAPELFERLGRARGVTYSTVKTIVDRLEQKGAVERVSTEGRTIFYKPAIKQERLQKPLLKSLVRRLFGGDLRPLFAQLLRDERLSNEDLEYVQRLVEEARRKK
jgi:BlaI family penicillinase repressor